MIETAVAMVVIAIATIAVLNRLDLQDIKVKSRQFEVHLELLKGALNSYYARHCSTGLNPNPTKASLVSEGHLGSSDYFSNPFSGEFQVSINWAQPHTIGVNALFSSSLISYASNNFSPSTVSGTRLFWNFAPDVLSSHDDGEITRFVQLYTPRCDI